LEVLFVTYEGCVVTFLSSTVLFVKVCPPHYQ
jgi:hypothetical protein